MCNCNHSQPPEKTPQQNIIKRLWETSLDNILSETNIDTQFDILSIDVDGNDYHIWNSLKRYDPAIVIIEFNPFINPTKDYIYSGSVFGSSFKSMIELAKVKKYSLLCMSGNLVFGKNNRLIGTSLENYINNNPYDLFLDDAVMTGKKHLVLNDL